MSALADTMLENSWWSGVKIITLVAWLLVALVVATPSGPAAAIGWLLGAIGSWYVVAESVGYALDRNSKPAQS